MNRVVASAKEYLIQWKSAQVRSNRALLQNMIDGDGANSYVKPQMNTVKVTADAAIFKDREEFSLCLGTRRVIWFRLDYFRSFLGNI